jgi:two-component system response regulator HydG
MTCSTPKFFGPRRVDKDCLLKLLITVEQDSLCRVYSEAASALGYSIVSARNVEQAIYRIDSEGIDVVLFDLIEPFARDLENIREIRARYPGIEVLVTCASSSVDLAVQVMKIGAYDYLPKPFSLEQLKIALNGVAAHLRSKTESRLRCEQLKTSQGFGGIIGRTPEMEKLYLLISKASQAHTPCSF